MSFSVLFCVFARPAIPGLAKTRLAARVGDVAAAHLASAFFRDTWASVAVRPDCVAVLATTGAPDGLGASACGEIWFQGDGDLGARVERVLRRGLGYAPWVVAIGADSPGMPPDRIDALIAARATADAAIIPAEDGGFVALAVSRCPEGVLADVPWSASDTCDTVVRHLRERGLTVEVLAPWWDVDEPADLDRLRDWLAEDPRRAWFTSRALAGDGADAAR